MVQLNQTKLLVVDVVNGDGGGVRRSPGSASVIGKVPQRD